MTTASQAANAEAAAAFRGRLVPVGSLQLHPEAGRVPMMRPAEYADFLADVKERGVRVAIEVQPGTSVILDGRCRFTAAKEAGIEVVPVIDAPINGDDPVVYLLRAASKRRQLSEDQRATIAREEEKWLADKGRQERAQKAVDAREEKAGRKPILADAPSAKIAASPRDRSTEARAQAARHHNVGERKMKQAKKVEDASPELFEQVKRGEKKLAHAAAEVDRERKRQELETKAAAAPPPSAKDAWVIHACDCVGGLAGLEAGSVRLAFADPPYNMGIDYGLGAWADRRTRPQYLDWCHTWMAQVPRVLADDGSFWVLIDNASAAEFKLGLEAAGLHLQQWLIWFESFGVNNPNGFNRTHRHLLWFVKDPMAFVFNETAVLRPSDREAKYGDSRAQPGGKTWDSVWGINPPIPRLSGTCAERMPGFPTQLPLALLTPIVSVASDPGDLVCDLFAGSASLGEAALSLDRRFVGFELSDKFAGLGRKRLQVVAHNSKEKNRAAKRSAGRGGLDEGGGRLQRPAGGRPRSHEPEPDGGSGVASPDQGGPALREGGPLAGRPAKTERGGNPRRAAQLAPQGSRQAGDVTPSTVTRATWLNDLLRGKDISKPGRALEHAGLMTVGNLLDCAGVIEREASPVAVQHYLDGVTGLGNKAAGEIVAALIGAGLLRRPIAPQPNGKERAR